MTARPVICLGCAFWDTIFKVDEIPRHGTKVLAEQAVQAASGMATAAAATIARLGSPVEIWTRIGDDATGDAFLQNLAAERVGVDHVRRVPGGRTWISTILVDRAGERLVVPYADPGLDTDASWLPLHRVADAGAVLVDVRWIEGARALLDQARRDGVPTILDADIAPPEILRELIPLADHVLFSEPALLSLVPAAASVEAALDAIVGTLDAAVVGVTCGAQGALIRRRGDRAAWIVPTIPIVARDTLNAGDVWHGAYVHGLVQGWDLERVVRVANVAAAIKCERFGGRLGAPALAEVWDRLDEAAGA
ncbi:MAG TPA: PfkB family carbohydrate kinase [Aliidongia sp.]|uniref:PfkB family carbohydrate kinase n=1 Tax=Aliidongia sp. TaxID=1914230 RepID=UPI002DDD2574|nr:PfkB family carbohydrate kinase [Aliidongia sp.]HEV2677778.1 PfkB family carbohydrate kinase [Aliidongia sp.]